MTAVVVCLTIGGLILGALVWGGPTTKLVVGVVVGICLIIGALLSFPFWLFAAAWVGAPADIRLWALFCAVLALEILVLLAGVSLVRGRLPRGRARLASSVVVIVPLGLFLFVFQNNHGAARVNSAVSRAYEKHRQETFVELYTLCDYKARNADGSESWVCEVEPYHEAMKTCSVDVRRRTLWRISVQLKSCNVS